MENCETARYSVKYYILFLFLNKITISCIFLLTTISWSGMIFLAPRYAESDLMPWRESDSAEKGHFLYGRQYEKEIKKKRQIRSCREEM